MNTIQILSDMGIKCSSLFILSSFIRHVRKSSTYLSCTKDGIIKTLIYCSSTPKLPNTDNRKTRAPHSDTQRSNC